MRSYNNNHEKNIVSNIEMVDYHPNIAGMRIEYIPFTAFLCLFIGYILNPMVSIVTLIIAFYATNRISKKEEDGHPITLEKRILMIASRIPFFIRAGLFPSIAYVISHLNDYRA